MGYAILTLVWLIISGMAPALSRPLNGELPSLPSEIFRGASRSFLLPQSEITVGQTIEGKLEEDDKQMHDGSYYDLYFFNGRRGQKISIDLKSSDFDPYLTLLDRDGTEIVSDNDSGGDHNSRIVTTLTYTGRYFIRVNSLKKDGKGKYILQLR